MSEAPRPGAVTHHSLAVFTLAGDKVRAIIRFEDTNLFPGFGLPLTPLPH